MIKFESEIEINIIEHLEQQWFKTCNLKETTISNFNGTDIIMIPPHLKKEN